MIYSTLEKSVSWIFQKARTVCMYLWTSFRTSFNGTIRCCEVEENLKNFASPLCLLLHTPRNFPHKKKKINPLMISITALILFMSLFLFSLCVCSGSQSFSLYYYSDRVAFKVAFYIFISSLTVKNSSTAPSRLCSLVSQSSATWSPSVMRSTILSLWKG